MSVQSDSKKQWTKIIAKAWADDEYKVRLLADSASVLAQEGIILPEGATVKVVEAVENETVFVLPAKPEGEAPEDVEERIAAAYAS